jgi:hypothetical protein
MMSLVSGQVKGTRRSLFYFVETWGIEHQRGRHRENEKPKQHGIRINEYAFTGTFEQ